MATSPRGAGDLTPAATTSADGRGGTEGARRRPSSRRARPPRPRRSRRAPERRRARRAWRSPRRARIFRRNDSGRRDECARWNCRPSGSRSPCASGRGPSRVAARRGCACWPAGSISPTPCSWPARIRKSRRLPFSPGMEICGVVDALGPRGGGRDRRARRLLHGRRRAGGVRLRPGRALRERARRDARRARGRLPRGLRHVRRGAELSRATASRRDAAGHGGVGRRRADGGRDRQADRSARDRGRARRGQARRGPGGGRGSPRRRRRRHQGGGQGARRRGRRLRRGRRKGVRRGAPGDQPGRAAAADRLRERRRSRKSRRTSCSSRT